MEIISFTPVSRSFNSTTHVDVESTEIDDDQRTAPVGVDTVVIKHPVGCWFDDVTVEKPDNKLLGAATRCLDPGSPKWRS